jgi:hypothetical protein
VEVKLFWKDRTMSLHDDYIEVLEKWNRSVLEVKRLQAEIDRLEEEKLQQLRSTKGQPHEHP